MRNFSRWLLGVGPDPDGPLPAIHSNHHAVLNLFRSPPNPNDAGDGILPSDDGAMAEDTTSVGDDAAYAGEEVRPCRGGSAAYKDLPSLDLVGVVQGQQHFSTALGDASAGRLSLATLSLCPLRPP